MDLCQLGALLREERERRGLTLDAVADQTKITRTCLAAIEEGNEDCLPHPVYAKGFIKNYAKLLGLDNKDFLDSLTEVYQTEEQPVQSIPLLHEVADGDDPCVCHVGAVGKKGKKNRALLLGLGVLVLLGLGWYGYTAFFAAPGGSKPPIAPEAKPERTAPAPVTPTPATPEPAPAAQPAQTAPPAPSAQAAPPTQAAQPTPAAPPTQAPVAPAQPAPQPTTSAPAPAVTPTPAAPGGLPAEATPADRATQDIAMSGQAAPAAPAPSPTAKHFTVGETGEHVVQLTSTGRCWIQAGADGGSMHETILDVGDSFTGKFNNYLLMRLGNAGAVEITFDGKQYPLHAAKGSVKTLKFVGRKPDEPAAKPTEQPAKPDQPAALEPPRTPEKPVAEAKPAAAPAATSETPAAGAKELEVFGQDGSWVILMPDSGPAKEVYVKKGQRLTVPFNDKIEVKLGNPSNVVFRYGGKETPVTTEKGETKSIRFP